MLDSVFLRILDMSLTGALVIAGVLLGRLLLKKAPKVFSYALWGVVLLRLLCPVSVALPVSLLPQREPVAQSYQLSGESISVIDAGVAAYQVVGDALNGGLGAQHVPTTRVDSMGNREYVVTDWWNVTLLAGQYLWLAGAVGMALWGMYGWWKLRRRLVEAVPLQKGVLLADDIPSPFVVGFFRPRIYLPGGLTPEEQTYILLHERQHIRRGDPVWKTLFFAALCLHWFNPLVWLAFALAGKDMEMSCDEAVLRKLGPQIRGAYAQSLLNLATGRHSLGRIPLAFGEGNPGERIRNLSGWKKPALWISVAAAAVCVALGVCLIADPVPESGETPAVAPTVEGLPAGSYRATDCLYLTPLSSYYPNGSYGGFSYTVTPEGGLLEGNLMGSKETLRGVHGWQSLEAAETQLAFLEQTDFSRLLLDEACRYQKLGDRHWLIQRDAELYLVKGGEKILWYILMMEPAGSGESAGAAKLTLAEVLRLSRRETPVRWSDLSTYACEDIGSGLYICLYEIDPAYTLVVSDSDQEGEPWKAALCCHANGSSVDIRTEDVAAFIARNREIVLQTLIEQVILEQYASHVPESRLAVESHVELAREISLGSPTGETERVFLQVCVQQYDIYEAEPRRMGGSFFPVAITFAVDEAGQYTLQECWRPRDGGYFADDIREKFPGSAAEHAIDPQPFVEQLQSDCDRKAREWLAAQSPLRETIAQQFRILCGEPEILEDPASNLRNNAAFPALLGYGTETLRYCFSRFTPGSQPGGEAEVMAYVCQAILEELGEQDFPKVAGHESGNAWFNHFAEYAQALAREAKPEEIEKYHPGAWLLLTMREDT